MPPRTYRIFLAGQVTSLLGDGLALLAIPILVLQLTRSPLLAGLASAARAVGYVVAGLPAGPLVDRLDARSVLICTDLLRALLFLALGLLATARSAPVALVLLLAFAAACTSVFADAALAVTMQDLFPGPRVLPANATLETAAQLSRVLGPAAAGVLIAGTGVQVTLLVNAASFVVALVTVLRVRTRAAAPARTGGIMSGLGRDFADGLRHLWRLHPIIDVTLVVIAVNLCLAVDTMIVYFAQVVLGLGPALISVVVAAGGAGGVAGALAAPRLNRRFRRLPMITVAILVASAAVAAMAAAHTWQTLPAANAVMVFGTALAGVLNRSMRQELVPRDLLGRVTITSRTLFLAATPAGTLVAGSLTAAAGDDPRPVFLTAGLVLATVMIIAWYATLRRHTLPRRSA